MRKSLFLITLILCFYFLDTAVLAQSQNLIQNGGFESGTSPWAGSGTSSFSSSAAHTGTFGFKLKSGTNALSQDFSVIAKKTYKLSGWVRLNRIISNGTTGGVYVRILKDGVTFEEENIVGYLTAGSWIYYEQDFDSFDNTGTVRLSIVQSGDGQFDIDFDDLALSQYGTEPKKVFIIGDSTTASENGNSSYRYYLWKNLLSAGYTNVDFVGDLKAVTPYTTPSWPIPKHQDFDRDYYAFWGTPSDGFNNSITQLVTKHRVDYLLVHLGTNDFLNISPPRTPQAVIANLTTLVTNARKANPNITILVCQIIPTAKILSYVMQLNQLIPGFASQNSTSSSRIIVVDQYSGYLSEDGAPHPLESGQVKMGAKYAQALQTVLTKPTNTQSPQPTVTAQPTKPGDANKDNVVNGLDYVTWLLNYNLNKTGPSFGDFNSSGLVDGLDYVIWVNNYGK